MNTGALLAKIEKLLRITPPGAGGSFDGSGEVFMGAISIATALYGADSPQVRAIRESKERASASTKLSYSGRQKFTTQEVQGMLTSMRDDIEAGLVGSLRAEVAGEVLADFIVMAKDVLESGGKDVAAVLACAALEDALKQRCEGVGHAVADKSMSEVIGVLKSEGLVRGPRAKLLGSFVTIRNKAFHANWGSVDSAEVQSVIAFVEEYLTSEFQRE